MSPDSPAPIRRILVAIDASTASLAILQELSALAARLDAELLGLFVEDVNLLRLAGLPFARELALPSAITRRLVEADMQRLLRSQAARVQRTLAAVAEAAGIRWSFRIMRGQVAARLLEAAREADLLVLAVGTERGRRIGITVRTIVGGAPRPVLLLKQGFGVHPPLLVLYSGTPAADRALATAVSLSRPGDPPLAVLILAAAEDEARRLEAQAVAAFAGSGVDARYRRLKRPDLAELARIVRTEAIGTMVIPTDSPLANPEQCQDLLARLGCAVMVA